MEPGTMTSGSTEKILAGCICTSTVQDTSCSPSSAARAGRGPRVPEASRTERALLATGRRAVAACRQMKAKPPSLRGAGMPGAPVDLGPPAPMHLCFCLEKRQEPLDVTGTIRYRVSQDFPCPYFFFQGNFSRPCSACNDTIMNLDPGTGGNLLAFGE